MCSVKVVGEEHQPRQLKFQNVGCLAGNPTRTRPFPQGEGQEYVVGEEQQPRQHLPMGQQLQSLFGEAAKHCTNPVSLGIFRKLHHCHTADLGMHTYRCDDPDCNHLHHQYHSCGNRHCPNCGGLKKEQWIEDLSAQLFPTAYYHLVFTVPHEFNGLTLGNRKAMYNLLFEAASATLLQFSHDPKHLGATCGITTVLHTWGQNLSFHPHLHCIVSGGGVKDGQWVKPKRVKDNFLFPVPAMRKVYKGIFLKKLRILVAKNLVQTEGVDVEQAIKQAGFKKWNVYAKKPFGSVATVVEYLGRYTHKVAITKHRLTSITKSAVVFNYKDYADGDQQKSMELPVGEFMRRFEQHFLPRGFVKIRHFGFLQNHGKTTRLNAVRATMDLQPLPPKVKIPVAVRMLEKFGKDIAQCPTCNKGKLILVAVIYPHYVQTVTPRANPCKLKPLPQNKASP